MTQPVVILIEDEIQIRRFVRAGLEAQGWLVHEADTARRGLADAGNRLLESEQLDMADHECRTQDDHPAHCTG